MKKTLVAILAWVCMMQAWPAFADDRPQWTVGEGGHITAIAVSRDGTHVGVGSHDAQAVLFDRNGESVFRAQTRNTVTGVELLGNGTFLVSSDDRHLYAYNADGSLLWDADMKMRVKDVAASGDGDVTAVILQGGASLTYIDSLSGETKGAVDLGSSSKTVKISDNGEWTAVGASDQYVYMLDRNGERMNKIGISGPVQALAVSDAGEVAAGSIGGHVELFGPDGRLLSSFKVKDNPTSLALSADGKYVAVSDLTGYSYVFSREGSKLWESRSDTIVRQVAFSPESSTLYSGTDAGIVNVYDVGTVLQGAQRQASLKLMGWIISAAAFVMLSIVALYRLKKRNQLNVLQAVWKSRFIYLALLPGFGLLFIFLYYPGFSGLYHSLYDWNPGGRTTFVGLDNFRRIFHDPYVTKGIGNLLLLIVTGLFKAIIPPLLTAELIYHLKGRRLQYGFRTAFVSAMVLPGVAMLLIWQNLYDPNMGLINEALEAVGLGSWAHAWLGDPKTAIWAIIFIGFPFVGILQLLVFYAGLLAIPEELIESAKIDGAGLTRIIRSIHLPLLSGQFKLLIILALIGTIQDFGSILIVTGGGPMGSTYVPALQMYYAATQFNDLGYASALGVAMFVVIMIVTVLNMKLFKSSQE
ncbi:ABC transporter permease subunit [Paenibacillaceae bacterium WGS1546]|uniref:ABC transporter permease subunit n=1 Tax=Cohnella sp. WGS1546 TaxID=3366810 RepID=UPI00372D076F